MISNARDSDRPTSSKKSATLRVVVFGIKSEPYGRKDTARLVNLICKAFVRLIIAYFTYRSPVGPVDTTRRPAPATTNKRGRHPLRRHIRDTENK